MSKNFLNYLLIFLVISLGFQLFMNPQVPANIDPEVTPLTLKTSKKEFSVGKIVELNITNNTDKQLVFPSKCPVQPFNVISTTNNEDKLLNSSPKIDCQDVNNPVLKDIVLPPQKTTQVRYTYWSHDLFSELGEYKIGVNFNLNDKEYNLYSNSFEIVERGFFGNLWTHGLYQPIYNFLIWVISLTPGFSLGVGIIVLTVLLRLALYFPNQKALLAQKRMAEVQPKLAKIRDKYKDNQQKMAEETMKIWKEHKVNPVSSCLPILVQFPILIALFYVIQDGLNPDKTWLLYNFIGNFDLSTIHTNFLNILDLTQKNLIALPLAVGALQFIQLKVAMNKKTDKEVDKNDPNVMMQGVMLYVMPAMIAVFTASLPAGVGLYWGTSTLFGIIQQLFVNRAVDKELSAIKNDKSEVRVIDVN